MVSDRDAAADPDRRPRHLHPATMLVAFARGAPSTLLGLPAVLGAVSSMNIALMIGAAAFAIIATGVLRWVAWRRFTYTLTDDAVVIESGVFSRNRRTIPYARIADAGIERGPLHRLLGLAILTLETGGSGQDDGKLDSVSVAEADRLRAVLRQRRSAPVTTTATEPQSGPMATVTTIFAMDTGRVLLAGLFNFSLVWIAVGFGALQFLSPAFGIEDKAVWQAIANRTGMIDTVPVTVWAATAATGVALIVVLGVTAGLIRTTLREHGFLLTEGEGRLRRTRGLLTRSEAVIALPRIQLAAIDTGPVRRLFGWQRLRGQLLGGEGETGRQDFAPLATAEEVDRLLAVLRLSRIAPALLTPVSHGHIWRAVLRYVALPGLAIAVAALWNAAALYAVPLLLPVLAVGLLRRRHHRYAINGTQLQVQRGVIGRTTWVVPIGKIQSVTIRRGWIQRRLGLVSVRIDTAGGGMFDGPDIEDLRVAAAATLVEQLTAGGSRPQTPPAEWWESGVIYQVYPRSFQDSDGDGIGDLAGIAARLDHIASLGVDAIWLSPIFPSPMADFGYDVADYCDVATMFGDLETFDRLLASVHAHGLKLILDFVPNHSSDQHPWFVASRSSRDDPKRDWYIWRDAAAHGGPPNNWISDFGGSAWTWDEQTGQYYLHAFLKEQPDLNWRNADLRAAMMDVLRFWLDRGVDGFRIDVLWHIVKAEGLPDNPPNPDWTPAQTERDRVLQQYSTDQPEAHAIAADMRTLADAYGDRVLIGEIFLPNDRLARWYGTPERPQVHLPFNFQLIENAWDAATLARVITDYEASLPPFGWPNWVIGSHDAPRIAARIGEAQARVAAMLLLTLRGTPTLYQGDEIGIGQVDIPPDRIRDPQHFRQPTLNIGRDRSRTPMPWNASPNAGFTTGEPWLPINPDWPTRNVAAQDGDPASMLTLYRALLALRRSTPALSMGSMTLREAPDGVLAYERRHGDRRLLVLLNLTSRAITIDWHGTVLLSTLDGAPEPGMLYANEGLVIE